MQPTTNRPAAPPVPLDAARDFIRLRKAVWTRFHTQHPVYTRERFDDAYAEWWTQELARNAAGRPSRPGAPIALITQAVHRVLIDENRTLARGLSRGAEKDAHTVAALEDEHRGAMEDDAPYRLLVHQIVDIVRGELTEREWKVFITSYLCMRTTVATAEDLGLSEPRVRKDRRSIVAKVGEPIWTLLRAELDLCPAYESRLLPSVFELLTEHVDSCDRCRTDLGLVRATAHDLDLLAS